MKVVSHQPSAISHITEAGNVVMRDHADSGSKASAPF